MYIPAVAINLDALYIIDKILDNLDFTDWMSSITMPKNLVAVTLGISALLIFRCSPRSD